MTDLKLKYFFGLTSILLFGGLLYEIILLPGGLILPGYFMGGILLPGILIVSGIVAAIARLIFKRNSFITLFAIITTVAFSGAHYYLYSPALTIVTPAGYTGEVNLVLSNVDNNILTLDSNGIGYINKRTFDRTYNRPVVVDEYDRSLDDQLVGFAPSNFWAKGYNTSTRHPEKIHTLSFKIVPKDKAGEKQHYNRMDFIDMIDTTKLLKNK